MAKVKLNLSVDEEIKEILKEKAADQHKTVAAMITDFALNDCKIMLAEHEKEFAYRDKVYAEVKKALADCDFEKANELMKFL